MAEILPDCHGGKLRSPKAMVGDNQARILRFGVYQADLRSGELLKNGVKVRLQEQPFQVLSMLLERPGDVVTREELRQRLWPADTFVDFDHSLNTAINKLREALGDVASNPRFVETLPRRGYRFIAPVSEPSVNDSPSQVASAAPVPAVDVAPDVAAHPELPPVHRGIPRALLILIQTMYLVFYSVGLAKLKDISILGERVLGSADWVLVVVVLTAVLGIPFRLYLLTAVAFDYRRLGQKFRPLFPFLMALDLLWALCPFLLIPQIGFGLAFAITAALLYLPFSQRTLVRMAY